MPSLSRGVPLIDPEVVTFYARLIVSTEPLPKSHISFIAYRCPLQVKTGITGNPKLGNRLTNREVLAALDASVNMLPYVYDTFKWPHCVEAGVDFDDAWGTASSAAD